MLTEDRPDDEDGDDDGEDDGEDDGKDDGDDSDDSDDDGDLVRRRPTERGPVGSGQERYVQYRPSFEEENEAD